MKKLQIEQMESTQGGGFMDHVICHVAVHMVFAWAGPGATIIALVACSSSPAY